MSREAGNGSLKCVVVAPAERERSSLLAETMRILARDADLCAFGTNAMLLFTDRTTAEIRDELAGVLRGGESVLVMEFERWSASGPAVDAAWLSRHGH